MARYLLLWVHGPWIASGLMLVLALRLLLLEDFSMHGDAKRVHWGLHDMAQRAKRLRAAQDQQHRS
jgi:hypothetical protein